MHKHELKKHGVKVISAMENIPDTPEGIILEGVIESMNEYYSKELSQKIMRGMKENRLKGFYQGGGLPYGYKIVDRKIFLDETTADVVEFIFNESAKGKYAREIAEELTNKGIYRDNKPFTESGIFKILSNEKYTGIYRKNGDVFEHMYPKIIDIDIFQKIRAKNKINKIGKQSLQTVYLLRNKLVCGYCGKPISSETGRTKAGKKINYYKCTGRKKFHNNCNKETVRQDVLEKFVLDVLITELSKPENLKIIINNILSLQENESKSDELNILLKTKKQIENSLENIMEAVEKGLMNKTTVTRMQSLEKQLDEIEKQIILEQVKSKIKVNEKDVKEHIKTALSENALYLIQNLIDKIIMYNDKMEIILKTNSPDNKKDCFLFFTKKYLPKHIQNKIDTVKIEISINFYL